MRQVQPAEGPVQHQRHFGVFEAKVLAQQFGIQQVEREVEIVEFVIAEIDAAFAARLHAAAAKAEASVQHAIVQRADGEQIDHLAQRLRRQAGNVIAGPHLAGNLVAAGLRVKLGRHQRLPAALHHQRAIPVLPGAITQHANGKVILRPGQAGQEAPGRRAVVDVDIEHVAVRLRIDQHGEAIFPAKAAIRIQQDTAVANIGLRLQANYTLFAQHAFGDAQVDDIQPVHPDVEVRQGGRVGIAGIKLRHGEQGAAIHVQLPDIEAGEEEFQRAPVEINLGQYEKQRVVRIAQAHIVERRFGKDVALNPPDLDREAGSRGDFGNTVHDVITARLGIDEYHRAHDKRGDQQEQAERAAPKPAPLALARRIGPHSGFSFGGFDHGALFRRGVVHYGLFGHQKAWPSEI